MNLENMLSKKPVSKDDVLYDSIYVKCLEWARKYINGWLGLGGWEDWSS